MSNLSFLKSIDVVIRRNKKIIKDYEIIESDETYLDFFHIYTLAYVKITLDNNSVIEGTLIDFNVNKRSVTQLILQEEFYNKIIDVENIRDIEVIEEEEEC